jgi:YidC/Oxa1 family membrane protein insertase
MDRRLALALVLSFLVLLVFQTWIAPKSRPPVPADSTGVAAPGADGTGTDRGDSTIPATRGEAGLPAAPEAPFPSLNDSATAAAVPETLVVTTAAADAAFVSRGGLLARWTLRDYHTPQKRPVQIVNGGGELGLALETEQGVVDLDSVPFAWRRARSGDRESVTFTASFPGGLRVEKTYLLPASGYLMDLRVQIAGAGAASGYRLIWRNGIPPAENDPKEMSATAGTMVMAGNNVTTLHPGSFKRAPEKEILGNIHWAGVRNKYFMAAMVPPAGVSSRVVATGRSGASENPQGRTGAELAMPILNGEAAHEYKVYLGPMDYGRLDNLGYELEHAVNLGWKPLRPLSHLLLVTMVWMYGFLPNYGVVIILISALTKLLFHPLTRSSMRSMRRMQVLQPELEALRAKHKGDPQRMQREMMDLYKKNKINPMGGCLPILIQMPVFIALYSVLSSAIELRQAGFVAWIDDLSTPDTLMRIQGFPIHVLPVLMFLSTVLQQKVTPMTDPRQKMMGYLMPFVMLFIFYSFPSGLNLYWTVNNILTAAQNWHILREHAAEENAHDDRGPGSSSLGRAFGFFRRNGRRGGGDRAKQAGS